MLKIEIWIKYQERTFAEITYFCSAKSILQNYKANGTLTVKTKNCIKLSSISELPNVKLP